MTLNQAFAARVKQLMAKNTMSQYRLEQKTGISHSTMTSILNNKSHSTLFKTMVIIIHELNITVQEFFNSQLFDDTNLDID